MPDRTSIRSLSYTILHSFVCGGDLKSLYNSSKILLRSYKEIPWMNLCHPILQRLVWVVAVVVVVAVVDVETSSISSNMWWACVNRWKELIKTQYVNLIPPVLTVNTQSNRSRSGACHVARVRLFSRPRLVSRRRLLAIYFQLFLNSCTEKAGQPVYKR